MESKTIALIAIAVAVIIGIGAAVVIMNGNQETKPVEPDFPDLNEKVILMYFSATEVTDDVAKKIQKYLGCDIYRIEPKDPYSPEDLKRDDPTSRVNKEHQDPSFRPAIVGEKLDISSYSTVILGFPIWYHQEPQIIDTYLDMYDLSGKNVAPFCTSWSAGIANARINVSHAEPNANILQGGQFPTGYQESEIYEWLDKLGFQKQ